MWSRWFQSIVLFWFGGLNSIVLFSFSQLIFLRIFKHFQRKKLRLTSLSAAMANKTNDQIKNRINGQILFSNWGNVTWILFICIHGLFWTGENRFKYSDTSNQSYKNYPQWHITILNYSSVSSLVAYADTKIIRDYSVIRRSMGKITIKKLVWYSLVLFKILRKS